MQLLLSLLIFVLPLPPSFPLFSVPVVQQEMKVVVNVDELGGVVVGSKVRVAGQSVGVVSAIVKSAGKSAGKFSEHYQLELNIESQHAALVTTGTVALVTSPLILGQGQLGTVVDLMVPVAGSGQLLTSGTRIPGYTSYEKFWSADFSKLGIGSKAFQPS